LSTLADHLLPLITGFVVFVLFMAGLSFMLVQNKEKILHKLFGVSDTDLKDVKDNAQQLLSWTKQILAVRISQMRCSRVPICKRPGCDKPY
jgi:hypothetical protein